MPFKDEEVYLTEDQKLNGYQPFKLVLEAGGSASYDFPTYGNQTYGYIVPAENDGGDYYHVSTEGSDVLFFKYAYSLFTLP